MNKWLILAVLLPVDGALGQQVRTITKAGTYPPGKYKGPCHQDSTRSISTNFHAVHLPAEPVGTYPQYSFFVEPPECKPAPLVEQGTWKDLAAGHVTVSGPYKVWANALRVPQ